MFHKFLLVIFLTVNPIAHHPPKDTKEPHSGIVKSRETTSLEPWIFGRVQLWYEQGMGLYPQGLDIYHHISLNSPQYTTVFAACVAIINI